MTQIKELPPGKVAGHRGWVLVDGQLGGEADDRRLYLVLCGARGERQRWPLPVTLKGRVREVFCCPFGIARVMLECVVPGAVARPERFSLTPLSAAKAWLVMVRRVLGYWVSFSPVARRQGGFGVLPPLHRLARVYEWVGQQRAYGPSPDYPEWIHRCERLQRESWPALLRAGVRGTLPPLWICVDARRCPPADRERRCSHTLGSVCPLPGQALTTLVIRHDQEAAQLSAALAQAPSDAWVLYVEAGLQLAPWALLWFCKEAAAHPQARLIYTDHDRLDAQGRRCDPQFKPDWSAELGMVTGYFGSLFAVRATFLGYGLPAHAYRLWASVAADASMAEVRHIPAVLWHSPFSSGYATPDAEGLADWLGRAGIRADIEQDVHGYWRVRPVQVAPAPRVSVIVPTRNMLSVLRPCLESLLAQTAWADLEVLVVDNQSDCPDTLAYMDALALRDKRVRILRYDHPFNFSAINNFAVEQATGTLVCLLNNDTEVITSDWLAEMVARLSQPMVGAVGARLLFGDGRLQHAGDVLGIGGCAMHLHGPIAADDPGYMQRAFLPQDLSAVTAACLLTPRALYRALGGLEESHLKVAFNDVDYCLRVRQAGLRVLYTPYAELYHHESVSRGKDEAPEKALRSRREAEFLCQRWGDVMACDPFYNPNLNQSQPDFRLGKSQRVIPPWCRKRGLF